MVNRAILVGRLGRDPEMRKVDSGTSVVNFSVATDESWSDKNGERQKRTEWHKVIAWSKLAETCGRYLRKGQLVYIEGKIQTQEWDDRDGNKRKTTEIVASNMQMLTPRGGGSDEQAKPQAEDIDEDIDEEEIPF
jgi:single-strand DNA-binding protein